LTIERALFSFGIMLHQRDKRRISSGLLGIEDTRIGVAKGDAVGAGATHLGQEKFGAAFMGVICK